MSAQDGLLPCLPYMRPLWPPRAGEGGIRSDASIMVNGRLSPIHEGGAFFSEVLKGFYYILGHSLATPGLGDAHKRSKSRWSLGY